MNIDAATQTILVPGSVWRRETSKGPKHATVLFITNQGESEEVLAKNPMQVVFLTDVQEVKSMTPERFTKSRQFHTMDPHAETLINALLAPDLDEEDESDIDLDSIQLPENSEGDADVSLEDQGPATLEAQGQSFETVGNLLKAQSQTLGSASGAPVLQLQPGLDAALSHLLLSQFVSYSECMSPHCNGDTLHTLRFLLSPELGLNTLSSAFGLTGPITEFVINSAVEPTKVEIDGFLEVFMEVIAPMGSHPSQTFGLVQVTSQADIRAAGAQHHVEPEPEVEKAAYNPPEVEELEEEAEGYKPGVDAFILDDAPAKTRPEAAPEIEVKTSAPGLVIRAV